MIINAVGLFLYDRSMDIKELVMPFANSIMFCINIGFCIRGEYGLLLRYDIVRHSISVPEI
ncbi:MAG: hypothetical protein A4E24_01671 [Methanomethylovorans sp. PtaU1.Bin093]|jgi:hypothetical protein|nr:MAG: hypothetical protein A4E24_01671 [Methanomethylovorans sp. PtaU1.Bin093]